MAYHVVSNKQLFSATLSIAIFIAAAVVAVTAGLSYLDLPEVYKQDGKCIKVINYKNGDGYGCQDVDVTLRKYKTIFADHQ